MRKNDIRDLYFEWLCGIVQSKRFGDRVSFRKLLTRLHDTEFIFLMPLDENLASDGMDLRYRFILDYDCEDQYDDIMYELDDPCSVLEMMVALSLHCEENIMDDPKMGDRTGQWFWEMITNLGLNSMTDNRFDSVYVDEVIDTFLNREYEPDGRGGLFKIRNCDADLRDVEIWRQLCWYLNTIT